MIVLGLTGSIGMGKSTAARLLRAIGVPVHESDAAVHRLLESGGAGVAPVMARFPSVGNPNGGIDRAALGRIVFADPAQRKALEDILHPLVRQSQQKFLDAQRRHRAAVAVLDIPLLYETGAETRVDAVIVVTAPYHVQHRRVLRRGLSDADFAARLSSQMPDREKRARADFIVQTGLGFAYTLRELKRIMRSLTGR